MCIRDRSCGSHDITCTGIIGSLTQSDRNKLHAITVTSSQLNYVDISSSLTTQLAARLTTAAAATTYLPLTGGTLTGNLDAVGISCSAITSPMHNIGSQNGGLNFATYGWNDALVFGYMNSTYGWLSTPMSLSNTGNLIVAGTVNGVSPTTMSYLDPTSSIQTQLNNRLTTTTAASTYLPLTGGSISTNLTFSNTLEAYLTFANTSYYGPPSFTTRSPGTKITLYSALNAICTEWAMGVDLNTFWFSVPSNSGYTYNWYGGVTSLMTLVGNNLTVTGNINGVSPTKMGYLTGITADVQTQIHDCVSAINAALPLTGGTVGTGSSGTPLAINRNYVANGVGVALSHKIGGTVFCNTYGGPVSYTHLTLPTIYSV